MRRDPAITLTGTTPSTMTFSVTTWTQWVPDAYWRRKHWWSRPKSVGKYIATDALHRGCWGEGDTRAEAFSDLDECVKGWLSLRAQLEDATPLEATELHHARQRVHEARFVPESRVLRWLCWRSWGPYRPVFGHGRNYPGGNI